MVGEITRQISTTGPLGNVISQDPAAGSTVQIGSSVSMVVSLGSPQQVPVPDVTGLTKPQAVAALSEAGFVLGTVNSRNSDTVATGSIISQVPPAGNVLVQGSGVDLILSLGPFSTWTPPKPEEVAPPIDPTVATLISESTRFLYTGENPIQMGVQMEEMAPVRAAVLRGRVLEGASSPLAGVEISVLNHPEFGKTKTRDDGMFDMAVNGGGYLTLHYVKAGYLFAQRTVDVPWQDYVVVEDVILITKDTQVTGIDLTSTEPMQVAKGSVASDADGPRSAMVMIPQGTQAQVVLPDGSTQPVSSLNIRLTEYTVGEEGPKRMPAPLPPTSGYTYCVELSADESIAKVGGKDVLFSQPVPFYVDNFLNMPVGIQVPTAYYDNDKAAWIPIDDGKVIKILSITDGMADIDYNGDGAADHALDLSALGITDAERTRLALLYAAGRSLWRVTLDHFSTYDLNYGISGEEDSTDPNQPSPLSDKNPDEVCEESGSIIECQSQILGELFDIVGTPFTLNYKSDGVPGRSAANRLELSLSGGTVPPSLKRIEREIIVAGRSFKESYPAAPDQKYSFIWDGKDSYDRKTKSRQQATVKIRYVYDGYYNLPPTMKRSFGAGSGMAIPDRVPARQEVTRWQTLVTEIGVIDSRGQGFGSSTLDVHHSYDPQGRVLKKGNGTRVNVDNEVIQTVAGNGTYEFDGDGGSATQAGLGWPYGQAVGPDGSVFVSDWGNFRIRKITTDGIITTIAGNGDNGFSGDGGPAMQADLGWHFSGAFGPDGNLYMADHNSVRIRKICPPMPGFSGEDIVLASKDGRESYYFDKTGRHLRTVSTLTGAQLYSFEYDGNGLLKAIEDADGQKTTIERSANGDSIEVVGPFGQVTTLSLDENGYLKSVSGPGGVNRSFTHREDGLLTQYTDPNGNVHHYSYDAMGRLEKDTNPESGFFSSHRTELANGYSVKLTTAEGTSTSYSIENLSDGRERRINTFPDGTRNHLMIGTDGSREISYPDGTISKILEGPDPRFGMQSPIVSSSSVSTGGLTSKMTASRTASFTKSLSLTEQTDTVNINGRTSTLVFNAATKTATKTSPEGRRSSATIDDAGRVTHIQIPSMLPVNRRYENGRLVGVTQGSRNLSLAYNSKGYLDTLTDPLGRTQRFEYDSAGHMTMQVMPDNHTIFYDYDPNGNLLSLTPPRRPPCFPLHEGRPDKGI